MLSWLTGRTGMRHRIRSYSARSSGLWGTSLLAPTQQRSGIASIRFPFRNCRSLSACSSVLRMALDALKISSRNTTSLAGR